MRVGTGGTPCAVAVPSEEVVGLWEVERTVVGGADLVPYVNITLESNYYHGD